MNILRPTAREQHKGMPTVARIEVHRLERVAKPERDERLFAEAAQKATKLATAEGCDRITFEQVSEFIVPDGERIAFVYEWMFALWTVEANLSELSNTEGANRDASK